MEHDLGDPPPAGANRKTRRRAGAAEEHAVHTRRKVRIIQHFLQVVDEEEAFERRDEEPLPRKSARFTPGGKSGSFSTSSRSSMKKTHSSAAIRLSFCAREVSKKTFSRGIAYVSGAKNPRASIQSLAAA